VGIADDLSSIGDSFLSLGKNKDAVFFYKRSIMSYALTGNNERAEITLQKLEKAADQIKEDITLVRFFLKRWAEGKKVSAFCE
jgi:hypothetical protein